MDTILIEHKLKELQNNIEDAWFSLFQRMGAGPAIVGNIVAKSYTASGLLANAGARSPGTMADDATVGTIAWSNPNNAKVSDSVYASASLQPATTHYLKATNFGFSIPSGMTIAGIVVEIKRKKTSGAGRDDAIKIVKADGTIGTTNKSVGASWDTTEAYYPYGSSSDLWGEVWTPADINDVDFGVVLSVTCTAGGNDFSPRVDHIRMTVYCTMPTFTPLPPGIIAYVSDGINAGVGTPPTGVMAFYDGTSWVSWVTGQIIGTTSGGSRGNASP